MGIKSIAKRILRLPAHALLASGYDRLEHYIANTPSIWFNPYLSAKLRPYRPDSDSYIIRKARFDRVEGDPSGLPVPPNELILYKVHRTPQAFLSSGRAEVDAIRRIAEDPGFTLGSARRILDFGCGDGRLIRWFYDVAEKGEVWGVDILGEYIVLCQQYLSPPFRFATTTAEPHLPFEENSFDFVYACSVFTHISDLADAWLLELRRIVRPGGRLYITVHDDTTIRMSLDAETVRQYPFLGHLGEKLKSLDAEEPFLDSDWAWCTVHRAPGPGDRKEAQVFYRTDHLRQHWGSMFDIISITPQAYVKCQTAFLLRKPPS